MASREPVEVRFEPGGGAQHEHARVSPAEIRECVCCAGRCEEERTSAAGNHLLADLDLELAVEDVKAFGMFGMDVERRTTVVRPDNYFNNGKLAAAVLPAKTDIHRQTAVSHVV